MGSNASPSYCAVASPVQTTREHAGLALRFAYLREVFTVSNTISRFGLVAIPTTADWGVPCADVELTTPYRCVEMNANRSPVVMATSVSAGATQAQLNGGCS